MSTFVAQAYRLLIRPLLFRLEPETAQGVADRALRIQPLWRALSRALRVENGKLFVDLCGITLENPVGLAAGFDKGCELLPSLAKLGFGYLTAGTVTEAPRNGNAKPRVFRMVEQESLINALGFPGPGLEAAAAQLELAQDALSGTFLAVSVSGTSEEIVRCHRRLEPLSDAIEVNISSPNTTGLRVFHEAPALGKLIERVNDGRHKPLIVKLPPYPSGGVGTESNAEASERALSLAAVCRDRGVDGLTVANSRPSRDSRLPTGAGGLSGRAIFPDMLKMVSEIRAEVGQEMAINACGGIFSGDDAWKALKAGATTVQLYTGLVYRGPGIVNEINRRLLEIMADEGEETSITESPDE